jgi:hypothetical protein
LFKKKRDVIHYKKDGNIIQGDSAKSGQDLESKLISNNKTLSQTYKFPPKVALHPLKMPVYMIDPQRTNILMRDDLEILGRFP